MAVAYAPLAPTTVRADPEPLPRALAGLIQGLAEAVRRRIERVAAGQRRPVERARLAEMDERALRDIGLTRSDVLVEADKPFWRA